MDTRRYGIGFTDHALPVDDDDAAGQQVQQALQPAGQTLFLVERLQALCAGFRQLSFKLGNTCLQQLLRFTQTAGYPSDQLERLFKLGSRFALGRG